MRQGYYIYREITRNVFDKQLIYFLWVDGLLQEANVVI